MKQKNRPTSKVIMKYRYRAELDGEQIAFGMASVKMELTGAPREWLNIADIKGKLCAIALGEIPEKRPEITKRCRIEIEPIYFEHHRAGVREVYDDRGLFKQTTTNSQTIEHERPVGSVNVVTESARQYFRPLKWLKNVAKAKIAQKLGGELTPVQACIAANLGLWVRHGVVTIRNKAPRSIRGWRKSGQIRSDAGVVDVERWSYATFRDSRIWADREPEEWTLDRMQEAIFNRRQAGN